MAYYRRILEPGGTFFLTIVTHRRRPLFADAAARRCLHDAISATRIARPFDLLQIVLLPDHLHVILRLPDGDADFSTRVASMKATFTRAWLATGGEELPGSASRDRQRYRGVWQKRFWEHAVRDDADRSRCEQYLWFNAVKHGLATCPHAWPWGTFGREVRAGHLRADWCCVCNGRTAASPADLPGAEMDEVTGE